MFDENVNLFSKLHCAIKVWCAKISDKWGKVHFALEINQEQHIYTKCNVTFCIYGIFVNFYLKWMQHKLPKSI